MMVDFAVVWLGFILPTWECTTTYCKVKACTIFDVFQGGGGKTWKHAIVGRWDGGLYTCAQVRWMLGRCRVFSIYHRYIVCDSREYLQCIFLEVFICDMRGVYCKEEVHYVHDHNLHGPTQNLRTRKDLKNMTTFNL